MATILERDSINKKGGTTYDFMKQLYNYHTIVVKHLVVCTVKIEGPETYNK